MQLLICIPLLLLSLAGRLLANSSSNVAKLTDASFEHDTQATTGSTTGHWLVVFHDNTRTKVQEAMDLLTTPRENEDGMEVSLADELLEAGVVVGTMNYHTNPKTVQRLEIPGPPHAVLLAKGKLYHYSPQDEAEHQQPWDAASLKEFSISGYTRQTPSTIPPLPSWWEDHVNSKSLGEHASVVLVGLMGLALAVAMVVRRNMPGIAASFTDEPQGRPDGRSFKKQN